MTTLTREQVMQLIAELEAGSNWLSGKYNVYSYNRQPKIAAMFLKAFAEQGLPELLEELRKPHDWKLEGFGHYKDVTMVKIDTPFRAADAIESLARADLEATIAEQQAHIEQLRESVALLRCKTDPKYGIPIADKSLAIQSCTAALREHDAQLVERIAAYLLLNNVTFEEIADKIRNGKFTF